MKNCHFSLCSWRDESVAVCYRWPSEEEIIREDHENLNIAVVETMVETFILEFFGLCVLSAKLFPSPLAAVSV